jgi:hypothetical protein
VFKDNFSKSNINEKQQEQQQGKNRNNKVMKHFMPVKTKAMMQ